MHLVALLEGLVHRVEVPPEGLRGQRGVREHRLGLEAVLAWGQSPDQGGQCAKQIQVALKTGHVEFGAFQKHVGVLHIIFKILTFSRDLI